MYMAADTDREKLSTSLELSVWRRLTGDVAPVRKLRLPQQSQILGLAVLLAITDEEIDISGWAPESNCLGLDVEAIIPYNPEVIERMKVVCNRCDAKDPCREFMETYNIDFSEVVDLPDNERQVVLAGVRSAPYIVENISVGIATEPVSAGSAA